VDPMPSAEPTMNRRFAIACLILLALHPIVVQNVPRTRTVPSTNTA